MIPKIETLLPSPFLTERDDLRKLALPPAAKAYARRKGLNAMKRQPGQWARVNAMIMNPGIANRWRNRQVGQNTGLA